MKKTLKVLALLMALLMLVPLAIACKKNEETAEDTTAPAQSVSTETNKDVFSVAQTNWNADFAILSADWGTYSDYMFYDPNIEAGDAINDALYTRTQQVKDHLGVNIVNKLGDDLNPSSKFKTSYTTLTNSVNAGDDEYQLYLTHTYQSTAAMITEGLAYNLLEEKDDGTLYFPDLNLEASWWNLDAMKNLEVSGKLYYAHNDFLISDPNAVFFNKTMQANYGVTDPYEMVREGTWTLENMTAESMKVDVEGDMLQNNILSKDVGFCSMAEWYFISFVDSCDTGIIIDEGGYKTLDMGPDNERYANVFDQIQDLCKAKTSLVYSNGKSDVPDDDKTIASGKVLFTLVALHTAQNYRGTDVKFGILPYPKYDEDQEEYRSFDWCGLMSVPVSVQNTVMVGQVLETLGYFSSAGDNNVHVEYYEKLLGAKIADAPDDYEMLRIIYDGVCTNAAINMVEGSNSGIGSGLGKLIYAYMRVASSCVEGSNTKLESVSVQWAGNKVLAQDALDKTING